MPKPQPDAAEFAKNVLHHLCNLRAEIASLKTQISDLQKALDVVPPPSTPIETLEERESEYYKIAYQQACQFVKLEPTPPGSPTHADDV